MEKIIVAPQVVEVEPVGVQILIELLTQNEILGTTLIVSDKTKSKDAPQAYILKIGPKVDKEWGLKVGARCILSGSATPLPEVQSKNGRQQMLCEPHMIKALLIEKQ